MGSCNDLWKLLGKCGRLGHTGHKGRSNRMKIIFILGVIAVAANIFFILYAKRKGHKPNTDNPSRQKEDAHAYSQGFLNSVEGNLLKQSAAVELSISVEELNQMSVEEITHLAKKKELI